MMYCFSRDFDASSWVKHSSEQNIWQLIILDGQVIALPVFIAANVCSDLPELCTNQLFEILSIKIVIHV